MRRRDLVRLLGLAPLAGAGRAWPQATTASAIGAAIRREATDRSQVMATLHSLVDVFGPRLTASPNAKAAGAWAVRRLGEWGLKNGHLEPWDFGHPGWTSSRCDGFIVSPTREQLYVRPAAWTPGTAGPVTGEAVIIDPPDPASRGELAQYLASVRGLIAGKMVMVGKPAPLAIEFNPEPMRLDDKAMQGFLHPEPYKPEPQDPARLTGRQRAIAIDRFLAEAGARVKIRDSQRAYGELNAFANYSYDLAAAPPTVAVRNEDYSRIARLLADGTPVTLSFDIENQAHPEGATCFNALAELPGSDKADELVMLGAHLDCWHLAGGATDDAVGCAIMMEAVRILAALGVKPRRTIRIALWTGEEQGLYGSQAYVAEHFGTAEAPKPAFGQLCAYINIDGGTGRVRDANVFGPDANAEVLRGALKPYADLGVMGALAHGIRKLRSTDATTFSRAGLPAIGLLQDPVTNADAWHSNLDTYERVLEADAQQAAIVVAALLHDLSLRERTLLRFPGGQMPAAEGPAPSMHPAANET